MIEQSGGFSLLSAVDHAQVDWYLVFEDPKQGNWWDIFLRRGFRHVYALRWDGDRWLVYMPDKALTYVGVIEAGRNDMLAIVSSECSAILRFVATRKTWRWRAPWVLAPWTCVEQVKALLGIRHPLILTPWQLYRYVRAQNESRR